MLMRLSIHARNMVGCYSIKNKITDQPMPAGVLGLAVFFNGLIDHGYTLAVLAV